MSQTTAKNRPAHRAVSCQFRLFGQTRFYTNGADVAGSWSAEPFSIC